MKPVPAGGAGAEIGEYDFGKKKDKDQKDKGDDGEAMDALCCGCWIILIILIIILVIVIIVAMSKEAAGPFGWRWILKVTNSKYIKSLYTVK